MSGAADEQKVVRVNMTKEDEEVERIMKKWRLPEVKNRNEKVEWNLKVQREGGATFTEMKNWWELTKSDYLAYYEKDNKSFMRIIKKREKSLTAMKVCNRLLPIPGETAKVLIERGGMDQYCESLYRVLVV